MYKRQEQYSTRNDRYGPWTDIYALGAVLYRGIAGQTPVEAAERLLDDTLKPAVAVGAGRYSTNLLRVIDRALAVRPEQRFRNVAEMQAGLDGAQDEESDETVIMAPLSRSSKLPIQDLVPLRLALEGVHRPDLGISRPPPASRRPPIQPPPLLKAALNKEAGIPRRQLWGVLSGGAGLAALAAFVIWLWPAAPIPEKPPHDSLTQPVQPAEPSWVTPSAPAASETPTPESAAAVTLAPGIETAPPATTAETPLPMAPPTVAEPVTTVPTPVPALDSEPSQTPAPPVMQTETETVPPAVVDDQTAPPIPLPDSTPEDSLKPAVASPAETPLAPAIVPAQTKPQSGATTEQATAQQEKSKKPTAKNRNSLQNRSRTRREASRRDRTQPQPIIVTPTAPTRVRPAQSSRNSPWDSPNSTGFNQK